MSDLSSVAECVLARAREVLGRDDLTLATNFFEAGGDSLSALVVTAALQEDLDREIGLEVFFERETLGEVAAAIEAEGAM